MKHLLIACAAFLLGPVLSVASPADDVKAAAGQLSAASNYCWITRASGTGSLGVDGASARGTFANGAAGGITDNTTSYSVITRQGQNGAVEIVRHGERIVVKDPQGVWLFPDEQSTTPATGNAASNAQRTNRRAARQRPGGGQRNASPVRSGQVFAGGASLPTEEIVALIAEAKELKVTDDAISGDLAAAAAAARLGQLGGGGGQAATVDGASGSVSFTVKSGVIQSYEIHLKGSIQGRAGRTPADRTITTEIMDIDATKVVVPESAKVKLAS